jgi:hypothetical protein
MRSIKIDRKAIRFIYTGGQTNAHWNLITFHLKMFLLLCKDGLVNIWYSKRVK